MNKVTLKFIFETRLNSCQSKERPGVLVNKCAHSVPPIFDFVFRSTFPPRFSLQNQPKEAHSQLKQNAAAMNIQCAVSICSVSPMQVGVFYNISCPLLRHHFNQSCHIRTDVFQYQFFLPFTSQLFPLLQLMVLLLMVRCARIRFCARPSALCSRNTPTPSIRK